MLRFCSSAEAARELLTQIGVAHSEIDGFVHLDDEFQEHCEARTANHKRLPALGNRKSRGILSNPKISDAAGCV